MKNPDPISEWSQDEIGNWLRGLDGGLDKYKEALKYATGEQLLQGIGLYLIYWRFFWLNNYRVSFCRMSANFYSITICSKNLQFRSSSP